METHHSLVPTCRTGKRTFYLAALATVSTITAQPAHAVQVGFDGPYAPANWTLNAPPNGSYAGSVDTSGAPGSLSLTGNQASFPTIETTYTTTAAAAGQVSFDWQFVSIDFDADTNGFGYIVNGAFNLLDNTSAGNLVSGSAQFNVASGDIFGFDVYSQYSSLGPGFATISNFTAPSQPPAAVPGPLPLFGAGAAFGWSRRLRRRVGLASLKHPKG